MKKILLVLGLFLGFLGCRHSSLSRNPSSQNDSARHIIISIHGLGGDVTTWGEMNQVLKEHLKQINPTFNYEFHDFTYPTGDGKKSTYDFGHDYLGKFIKQNIFGNGRADIQPEDRITFVAHSQGGLVATIWYLDSLLSTTDEGSEYSNLVEYEKYARNVETIITLGTPFWGSKVATRMIDGGFGQSQELEDLKFGSNTIYRFRKRAIAISRGKVLKEMIKARMVNIAGVFPKDRKRLYYPSANDGNVGVLVPKMIMNLARRFVVKTGFGSDRYESDFAVLVPNSRAQFLFASDTGNEGDVSSLDSKDFKWADLFSGNIKSIITEAVHSAISNTYNVGMAAIPAFCLDPESCSHPTYRHILREIARCDINPCDSFKGKELFSKLLMGSGEDENLNETLQENLQGFTIEMVLRVPKIKNQNGVEADYDLEDPRFKTSPGLAFSTYRTQNNPNELPKLDLIQKDFFKRAVKVPVDQTQKVDGMSPLVDVYLGRDSESLSKQVTWGEITYRNRTHRDLRLMMTGVIRPSIQGLQKNEAYRELMKSGIEIPIEIELPGLLPRKVGVKVLPGISSFVELQMQPLNSN